MTILHQIASKAEYISDVARNAAYQQESDTITDTAELLDILRQLQDIADKIDQYHDWDD